ncbi:MAG: hypothetical protein QM614_02955, partial [Ottowia sp.]
MTAASPSDLADAPLLAAVAWLYLVINSTRVVTYVPQIVAAWRCTDGARAISLLTWGSWTVSHLSGLAYGALVLHDTFFVAITAVNLLGCASVTAIVSMHRWRLRASAGGAPGSGGSTLSRKRWPPAVLATACAGALAAALWLPGRWQPAPAQAAAL